MRSLIMAGMLISLPPVSVRADDESDSDSLVPNAQASDWGPAENGLRLRIVATGEIEQGMPLAAELQWQREQGGLPTGVTQFNLHLRDAFLALILTNRDGVSWTVKPDDPTAGLPPPFDRGQAIAALDEPDLESWKVEFPLVQVFDTLEAGTYQCRVQFLSSAEPSPLWRGTKDEWQSAGFWHGTIQSAAFELEILEQTPKRRILHLPQQLRLRTEMVQLRMDDDQETAVPAVYFDEEDAEEITFEVRNGHTIGTWCYRDGESMTLISGPPRSGTVNAVDVWYDDRGEERTVRYTFEVFETADPPRHAWLPGPGSPGYRRLWRKTISITSPSDP